MKSTSLPMFDKQTPSQNLAQLSSSPPSSALLGAESALSARKGKLTKTPTFPITSVRTLQKRPPFATDLLRYVGQEEDSISADSSSIRHSELDCPTKVKPHSQIPDIREFAEACPTCHNVGKKSGPAFRGGRHVQRWLCTYPKCPNLQNRSTKTNYYYWPDLISKKEEEFCRSVNKWLFVGGSQPSYAKELGIERETFCKKFNRLSEECLDYLEIQQRFRPKWGRTLAVDATLYGPWAIYAAFDLSSFDPVCYTVYQVERESDWLSFFKLLDSTGYRVDLIVSDKGPNSCIISAIKRHYGIGFPHQLDWIHEMREIDKILPLPEFHNSESSKRLLKRLPPDQQERKLCDLVSQLRYSSRENEFDTLWSRIKTLRGGTTFRGRQIIALLESDVSLLKTRLVVGKSNLTSNLAESSFGRFEKLFLDRIGIHALTRTDARNQVNRLFAAYRVKPFDRSEDISRNGRTTLELAATDAVTEDIWQFMPARKRRSERTQAH